MTKEQAQREAQEAANQSGERFLVYTNSADSRPVFDICAASETAYFMGQDDYIVSRHSPQT